MPGRTASDARTGSSPNPFNFVYGTREAAAAAGSLAGCPFVYQDCANASRRDCRARRIHVGSNPTRVTFKRRTADRTTREKSRFLRKRSGTNIGKRWSCRFSATRRVWKEKIDNCFTGFACRPVDPSRCRKILAQCTCEIAFLSDRTGVKGIGN